MRLKTVRRVVMLALGILMAPLIATAQQPAHVPSIGMLSLYAPPSEAERQQSPFLAGLRDLGYIEGQTITIASRYADGQPERLPALAAALVQLQVDLIVAMGGPPVVQAAQEATSIIPIIMAAGGADPVRDGLVASLARPGGNVTGVSIFSEAGSLAGKRVELLREALPQVTRVAVLFNPLAGPTTVPESVQETEHAAQTVGFHLQRLEAHGVAEIDEAFTAMTRAGTEALIVLPAAAFNNVRSQIVDRAATSRLPAIYEHRLFVDAGGLMSYGPDLAVVHRRAAWYVGRILKGAKPADLPVEQPMKFEPVINLKTAQALGLTLPPKVLFQADEIIR
jgi:putative tryptophan/tyrosine transport system substrate-binding protein